MTTIRYRVPSVSVVGASVPAWFGALAHKQWATPVHNATAIAANRHWLGASSVIDPLALSHGAHAGIIEEWTGMGVDETRKTIFMLRNGGHDRYRGNEVYSCDLSVDAPMWTRLRNASPQSGSGHVPIWSDGRPSSHHSEMSSVAGGGRWFSLGSWAYNYLGGTSAAAWWEFDVNNSGQSISGQNNDWINLGNQSTPSAEYGFGGGCALYDSVDNQIIVLRAWGTTPSAIFRSPSSMTSGGITNGNAMSNETLFFVGAVDTTNRYVVARTQNFGYRVLRINTTANKQAAWSTLPVTGTGPELWGAFHWHPPSGAFLAWSQTGRGLYKLTPVVSGGVYQSAEWTLISDAGFSGPTPPSVSYGSPMRGMYSKTQILQMADGNYVMIIVPRYGQQDVYVCKLTGNLT